LKDTGVDGDEQYDSIVGIRFVAFVDGTEELE
jgi:hypothetical protein